MPAFALTAGEERNVKGMDEMRRALAMKQWDKNNNIYNLRGIVFAYGRGESINTKRRRDARG